MNANSYAISQGLTGLKQLAAVTQTTQVYLKGLYKENPKHFDFLCQSAFHELQTQLMLDSMLRHRQAVA